MQSLHQTVVTKRELSHKAKLSIYRAILLRTHAYVHEVWVMTERIRSRIQATKMSFLSWVAGLSLRDRVRSSVIRERLGVDPLLLDLERSQLRWFGHLVRKPPERLQREVLTARPTGKGPHGRPGTCWGYCISTLAWEHLGLPQVEVVNGALERDDWKSLLEMLPPRPDSG